jgi:L-serine dehydratase
MAPAEAARRFRAREPAASRVRVTLYGSLGATGRGHLADVAIARALAPVPVEMEWRPDEQLPLHPNGMEFRALAADGAAGKPWRVYSVGGGALMEEAGHGATAAPVYDLDSMAGILQWSERSGRQIWGYVAEREGDGVWNYLAAVWSAMGACMERGLRAEGALPGGLNLARKSRSYLLKARRSGAQLHNHGLVSAYALAVAEENAAGGEVVTAPTCGSSGVLPAVLRFLAETEECQDDDILRALATAGLVGNLIKRNASISGAEVGCQGEIGAACAMAAAAAAQLLGGSPRQVEYAAEMGLEHHLGLTCDPVMGLVQIPCIERNAFAAMRAIDCADYALLSDGTHRVSFDEVVVVMRDTGRDLAGKYRETAGGGLAARMRGGA